MTDAVVVVDLTTTASGTTIGLVATPSFKPAKSFGEWLKYLRGLTGLTQAEAATHANVSFDAVKRIESGKLVGSTHLLAWLSWLGDAASGAAKDEDQIAADELDEVFAQWADKVLLLGMRIREAGLAKQPQKAKSRRPITRPAVSGQRMHPRTKGESVPKHDGHPLAETPVADRAQTHPVPLTPPPGDHGISARLIGKARALQPPPRKTPVDKPPSKPRTTREQPPAVGARVAGSRVRHRPRGR